MWLSLWEFIYPFSAFLAIRGAIRVFSWFAVKPGIALFGLAMALSVLTFHAGWQLFAMTAVSPHWWITPLIAIALAWVAGKNIKGVWKFESVGESS